jgi:hypothetical protein
MNAQPEGKKNKDKVGTRMGRCSWISEWTSPAGFQSMGPSDVFMGKLLGTYRVVSCEAVVWSL